MARHMQQTLPANLQYYQKSGGYVPPHIQQQMAQHMQKNMPAHLQQYVSPYMQQHVVSQHLSGAPQVQPNHINPPSSTAFSPHPPIVVNSLEAHTSPATEPRISTQPTEAAEPTVPVEPYAFITNPEKPVIEPVALFGLKMPVKRLALIGGSAVALIVVLSVLSSLLGSLGLLPHPQIPIEGLCGLRQDRGSSSWWHPSKVEAQNSVHDTLHTCKHKLNISSPIHT